MDLKSQAAVLKTQKIKDSTKVGELEQNGRRQKLEIMGVPEKEDENTNAIVLEVANMLDVDILSSHISAPHSLPKKTVNIGGPLVTTVSAYAVSRLRTPRTNVKENYIKAVKLDHCDQELQ